MDDFSEALSKSNQASLNINPDPNFNPNLTVVEPNRDEGEVRLEKIKKMEDLKIQLTNKQQELKYLTAKQEEAKGITNNENEAEKNIINKDIIKLQEEIKILGDETKVESEHARILREHGGLESNIPHNHVSWRIRP